jgi:hypothetical protein
MKLVKECLRMLSKESIIYETHSLFEYDSLETYVVEFKELEPHD